MHHTVRRALLASLLACGAVPATVLGATATVRVEGSGATLLPETPVELTGSPFTLRDPADTDQITVPADSATGQLGRAAAAAAVPVGFQVFDFGTGPTSFITRIGADTMPASFTPSWRVTVNHVARDTGADATTVLPGDRVVWAFVSDFATRELDLAVSGDLVKAGDPFEVTVSSHATDGTSRPAAGATVVYAGRTATAGATGRVTFTATGTGTQAVSATLTDEVRSPARQVCAVTTDASVCGLPTAPQYGDGTGGAAAAAGDTVAPGSRIAFPRIGSRVARVRGITGVAGPDRSDVARVEVALARRVGTQCRFMTAAGRLAAPGPCSARAWLRTRSAGGYWTLPLRAALAPGLWRVWSRATDGAGNAESTGIARINTGQFTVTAPRTRRAR
ncbi:MAG: hypothetical protein IT200_02455 [Thermoleophilia bacterium]|nr:hypothetical protein [Thermoleophilia bacterium]